MGNMILHQALSENAVVGPRASEFVAGADAEAGLSSGDKPIQASRVGGATASAAARIQIRIFRQSLTRMCQDSSTKPLFLYVLPHPVSENRSDRFADHRKPAPARMLCPVEKPRKPTKWAIQRQREPNADPEL